MIGRRGTWVAISLALASACPIGSPAAAQVTADVESVAFLSGWCRRMMVAGNDESATCRGPVSHIVYTTGRMSFAFSNGAGILVSFSGVDRWAEEGRVMLRLDRITVAVHESPTAATETGEGTCEFGDFDSESVTIQCAGRSDSGDFIGIFVTDGKPHRVERF